MKDLSDYLLCQFLALTTFICCIVWPGAAEEAGQGDSH